MQYDDNEQHGEHNDERPASMEAPSSLLPTVLQRLALDGSRVQPAQVADLVAELERDEWYVRAQAVRRLGMLGMDAPREPLMRALNDPHVSVRAAAIQAAGMLGERVPVSRLAQALHDSEWQVREMAALTLGTLGARTPVAALLEVLNDPDATVCAAARSALRQTRPEIVVQGAALAETMPHPAGHSILAALLAKSWRRLPRLVRDEYVQENHTKEGKFMQDTDRYAEMEPLTTRSNGSINGSAPNRPRWPRSRIWRTVGLSLAVVVVLINVVAWLLLSHVLQRGTQSAHGGLTPTIASTSTMVPTATATATASTHGSVGKTLYTYHPDALDLSGLMAVGWSPDGKRIAVSGTNVKTFDALTGKHITSYGTNNYDQQNGNGNVWSPDGTRLAISSVNVKIMDVRTGRVLMTYTPPIIHPAASIAIPGGNPKASLSMGNLVYASSWSPDSKMLASAVDGNGVGYDVQVWNASTGQRIRTLQVVPNANANDYIVTVAWSPDGKYIAASGRTVGVHIWDAATGHKILAVQDGTGIAWSPDSKMLASFGNDNMVHVREVATGRVLYSFHVQTTDPNTGYMEALAWSPNGKYIAVGNQDVRIFNATHGNLIYTYTAYGHTPDIHIGSLSWSPDSTMIASIGTSSGTGSVEVGRGASGSFAGASPETMKVWIAP
ncbi:MAG: PD40 domain-containing protein [Ktedonobacteraceae bacterium]|nr:PD40 domain-containing protein [Ktedonobacteraceae bacterium]